MVQGAGCRYSDRWSCSSKAAGGEAHRAQVAMGHIRCGCSDFLPALAQVLLQLVEWSDTQFPLDLCQVPLLGSQHLSKSLDFLLHLQSAEIKILPKGVGL